MEKDKIKIELKSEVLNEVLSSPPSWLVRSGNTLFFIFILLLLFLSWMISYPDELTGEIAIHSNRPPVEFQNQQYGKLLKLSVSDQQEVKKGMILAQFNNEIDARQLSFAQSFIRSLITGNTPEIIVVSSELEKVKLGTLQGNWTNLLTNVKERNALFESAIVDKKVAALQREIAQRNQLQEIASHKLKLIDKDIQLQKTQTAASKRLMEKKVLSTDEYLKEEKLENQLAQSYQNQKEALVQNEIQLNNLNKSLVELQYEGKQQLQKLNASIQTGASNIRNLIDQWKKSVAWIAPFDGKILFNKQLNVASFYNAAEASMVIVPHGNYYTGLIKLPSAGAGKIKQGQKVFIEFNDFQKNDFGMLEGNVKSITSISKDNFYEVEVKLPKKLITTYHKEIPLKAKLNGTAKIVTKNKRLIERFFEKVINLVEK